MIYIHTFIFNPFQENTYVLWDETKECVIIDPGCLDEPEKKELSDFIAEQKLKPVRLVNTHCHIDHIFGNAFVAERYKLDLQANEKEVDLINMAPQICKAYGLYMEPSPLPTSYLSEGDLVTFGNSVLEILFTPGHSKGSLTFFHRTQKFMLAGDVLFNGSIGRTDLPGGNFETLIRSIKTKLFALEDDYKVYSGHGPETSIGQERKFNPFLK